MTKNLWLIKLSLSLLVISLNSCMNPFAPALEKNGVGNFIVSDQKDIEGVFNNFRYAYVFKDTLVYGKLLANDFTFDSQNYTLGIPITWGREEDLRTTWGMFQGTQYIDLVWNEITQSTEIDNITQEVYRGFVLTVAFSPDDVVRVSGWGRFLLVKRPPDNIWQIQKWHDESF